MPELKNIDTERRNQRTTHIDELSTSEMVALINDEDHRCAPAVKAVLPEIAHAVDIIYERVHDGGRLIYCGAGTSGRLCVLDAAECPPTFGVSPDVVSARIAGGHSALVKAIEGAEDSPLLGEKDLREIHFSSRDVLVGVAASGRTPYVLGAMKWAHSLGSPVIGLTCCRDSELSRLADLTIAPLPGPEIITGSSRMKSGTCQKMVLNILSTALMIKLGKVYGNLMVDVKATNEKLFRRAISIVCTAADVDECTAKNALEQCSFSCKTAIVMLLFHLSAQQAEEALRRADGHIAQVSENDIP